MSRLPTTVWLASYPKSGNTWLRAMYSAWRSEQPPRLDHLEGVPMAASRQAFDSALGIDSGDLTADEIDLLRPRADEAIESQDRRAGEVRLRKVHDALFTGPAGEPVVSVAAARAAVYMIRDPRDVAVSFAHHTGRPLDYVVKYMASDSAVVAGATGQLEPQLRQRLGTWSEHVESWLDQDTIPVLVVRYEDCLRDPVAVWSAVLDFAQLPVDDHRVRAAVEACTFAMLQRQEQQQGFRESMSASSPFFRSGTAGAWVTGLPDGLTRELEDQHRKVMERHGYLEPGP
jgi:aryl sulfotransferase